MEKWFNKFGSLVRVDASLEEESVFLEFEKILEDTIKKVNNSHYIGNIKGVFYNIG